MTTLPYPALVSPDLPRAWNPDWRPGECIFRLNADIEITMAHPDDYPALHQIDRYFFLEHYPSVGVYRTQPRMQRVMEQQFQDAKWLRANESNYQYEITNNAAWWFVARDSHRKLAGYAKASQASVQDLRKPPFIGRRYDRTRPRSGRAEDWGLFSDSYILPAWQRQGIGRAFFYLRTMAMVAYGLKGAYTYVASNNNAHGFFTYGRPQKIATGLRAKPGQISDHGGFRLPYDYYVWHDLQYTVADCRAAMLQLERPKPPESIPRQYVIPLGPTRASR